MSQNRAVVENERVLPFSFPVIPKAVLTSLRSPMELTENDARDLIPLEELMMVAIKAVMKTELVKLTAVEELLVVEVREEVLTAVEEVKAAIGLFANVKEVYMLTR